MTWVTGITILASIVLAILAASLAYLNNLRLARRAETVERVSRQLNELYGPLLALAQTTERTFQTFRALHRPAEGFRDYLASRDDPQDPVAVVYRSWISDVFMPLNRQMMKIVLRTADLVEEDALPECFLDLCAHVSACQAVMNQWERGDYSAYFTPVPFPGDALQTYAAAGFTLLKARQASLLG